MKRLSLIGQRFGRLVVMADAGNIKGRSRWICRCDCGTTHITRGRSLKNGDTSSCGCFHIERLRSHAGEKRSVSAIHFRHGCARKNAKTAEYTVWRGMIDRCSNPHSASWHHYGGRGISVCSKWRDSFETFLADMGPRPVGPSDRKRALYSIDRINSDGNYEPSNCRWATQSQQVRQSWCRRKP